MTKVEDLRSKNNDSKDGLLCEVSRNLVLKETCSGRKEKIKFHDVFSFQGRQ